MGESCPKLLDLIPKEREWVVVKNRDDGEYKKSHVCGSDDESKKLELRLGLPGDEEEGWFHLRNNSTVGRKKDESQLLSLGYKQHSQEQKHPLLLLPPFPQYQTCPKGLPVMPKDSSQPCCSRLAGLQAAENKAFSPASANTAVPNTSQKRAAPAPVVGWPPVRSFRKNLASTSSGKAVSESRSEIPSKGLNEKADKGLFVKINMDGVPIGRKVDLNAYDSYEKLSSAVDDLFRGLLAAQRESCGSSNEDEEVEQKPITGLMDGSGEYTLVYEDNEGDRVLVADVPWLMFVSTVKRLRVLKSSDPDLPKLTRGEGKKAKVPMR